MFNLTKADIGKQYRTRDGELVKLHAFYEYEGIYVFGVTYGVGDRGGEYTVTSEGRYRRGEENGGDLIEEIKPVEILPEGLTVIYRDAEGNCYDSIEDYRNRNLGNVISKFMDDYRSSPLSIEEFLAENWQNYFTGIKE